MYEEKIEDRPDFSPGLLTFSISPRFLPMKDALAYPYTLEDSDGPHALRRLPIPELEETISERHDEPFLITRTFDIKLDLLQEVVSQPAAQLWTTRSRRDMSQEDPLGLARTFTLRLKVDEDTSEKAVQKLKELAGVLGELDGLENVSLVPLRYTMHRPSDPGYRHQWHHKVIGSEFAWDITMGDPDVAVAVVDTGIDLEHRDLRDNIAQGTNVTDAPEHIDLPIGYELDDPYAGPDKPPHDVIGHGTHVAGIIGSSEGNKFGGVGVAPRCRLVPIKCLLRFKSLVGSQELVSAPADEVAQGILAAAQTKGVRVINLSLGGQRPTMVEFRALLAARAVGCVVTISAGNDAAFKLTYPAAYKANRPDLTNHVIVVGATTKDDFIAHFSNFGDIVDVVAPGNEIYSSWPGDCHDWLSGTSMSAPVVAGLAALLFSIRPRASERQVVEAIMSNAKRVSTSSRRDLYFGYGRVDAERTLASF